jgi:hypothetical protein
MARCGVAGKMVVMPNETLPDTIAGKAAMLNGYAEGLIDTVRQNPTKENKETLGSMIAQYKGRARALLKPWERNSSELGRCIQEITPYRHGQVMLDRAGHKPFTEEEASMVGSVSDYSGNWQRKLFREGLLERKANPEAEGQYIYRFIPQARTFLNGIEDTTEEAVKTWASYFADKLQLENKSKFKRDFASVIDNSKKLGYLETTPSYAASAAYWTFMHGNHKSKTKSAEAETDEGTRIANELIKGSRSSEKSFLKSLRRLQVISGNHRIVDE